MPRQRRTPPPAPRERPETLYRTVLADPPWQYSNDGCRGAARFNYPTLTIWELCQMPIRHIIDTDALLILWATWPQQREAHTLIDAWGFHYVTGMPWVKCHDIERSMFEPTVQFSVRLGVGYWIRGETETILIARKGRVKRPDRTYTGLLSPNYSHSRKPASIYEYAEQFPGPRLELFPRTVRPGWDVYGNEIPGSITLPTPRYQQTGPIIRPERET